MRTNLTILTAAAALMLAAPAMRVNADTAAPAPAAPAATPAPTTAPVAPKNANRAMGTITAFDATAKTVTLTGRDNTTTTFTLDPAATIIVHSKATLADLKVGDTVRATAAADITEGATTVDAVEVAVVIPNAEPVKGKGKGRANTGYRKKNVEGVIATLTPLTITTPGGVTATINTTAATRVSVAAAGTTADLVVGAMAQANLTTTPTGPVAKTVNVMPHVAPVKRGKLKK